jgi:hypothetical protein
MMKKMPGKMLARAIMICSAAVMLCAHLFAWSVSSILLMLIASAVSLTVFALTGAPDPKGGGRK